jgi:hypothetical protein
MRQALLDQTKYNYEHKDDSGQFRSIFKEMAKVWKCKSGEHLFDVIPYLAGQFDPKFKPGTPKYVLNLFVHYGVGVNEDAYVCPARNYNKPCPICEYRAELMAVEDYDEDIVKSLAPKQRSIYNVVVYDNDNESAKWVQIFDVAHWYMERHLAALSKIKARPGEVLSNPYVAFSDPDSGKLICFERQGEGRNSSFIGHQFRDRGYVIPDEYIEQALCLDETINISDYEEIKAAFYGGEESEVGPDDVPEVAAETPAPAAPTLRKPPIKPAATPTPESPTEENNNQCPAGGVFGEQCEMLEACTGCVVWNECSEAHDLLSAEQAVDQEPPPAPAASIKRPAPAPINRPSPAAPAKPAPASINKPAPAKVAPTPLKRPAPIKR